jgi:diguanylate cyclase (GGDEF)-like protein
MVVMIGYAIPKKQSMLIRQIGILTLITFVYLFGYLVEINTISLEAKRFWNGIQYLAIPILPTYWLLISMSLIEIKVKTSYKIIFFLIPLITYIMRFTNIFHHLYYSNTYIEDTLIGPLMSIDYGVFYYLQAGFIIFSFLFANFLYLMKYKKGVANQKRRFLKISLSSFIPWFGLILNILLAKAFPLDYSAILFPIAILLIIFNLKEEHLISIAPFARNLMFMSSSEGVIVVNREKAIVDYNNKANEIFVNLKQLYSRNINLLSQSVPNFNFEMSLEQKNLMRVSKKIYQVLLKGILSEDQNLLGYVYSFTDVTENMNLINQLKENEIRIKELIYRDVLTGVNNRHYLDSYITDKKHLKCHYILMIDMNELKFVNDHFGHQKGDQLIISLANLITKTLGENDEFIRLGGDEFLIFSCVSQEEQLKDWIQALIDEALSIQYLSFAIGYSKVEKDLDFSLMYRQAEDRMYQNKKEMKTPIR